MDFPAILWDKTNIDRGLTMGAVSVPTYGLYGEQRAERPEFWVHCETIAARSSAHHWEIGLHRHENFFQLLYIRTGSGDALFKGNATALVPPCVVIMPPRVSHGYRFSQDVEGFVVTVVADQLRATAGSSKSTGGGLWAPQVVALEAEDQAYLDATIRRIAEEFDERRNSRNDLLEAYLTAAILLVGRAARPVTENAYGDVKRNRVEALKGLIARHFRDQMPAEGYARLLGLSPTHLSRLVREVTGSTVHDLIMARVIDEARRTLVFTPASIQQVAGSLGFSDPAYFSRCFRHRTGLTPGNYRRAERLKFGDDISAPELRGSR